MTPWRSPPRTWRPPPSGLQAACSAGPRWSEGLLASSGSVGQQFQPWSWPSSYPQLPFPETWFWCSPSCLFKRPTLVCRLACFFWECWATVSALVLAFFRSSASFSRDLVLVFSKLLVQTAHAGLQACLLLLGVLGNSF